MWLHWVDDWTGRGVRHAPDYVVRRADGTGVVVDVRPDDPIRDRKATVFAATRTCTDVDRHQQYLARNRNGYCGVGGTGVACPVGLDVE